MRFKQTDMKAQKEKKGRWTVPLEDVSMANTALVGGKGASLGEMMRHLGSAGVRVPPGFVVTTRGFSHFLKNAGLEDMARNALAGGRGAVPAKRMRDALMSAPFPRDLEQEIVGRYAIMEQRAGRNVSIAVRSSATAEDHVTASFAGAHESLLGISGSRDVLSAVRSVFASLFTDRAVSYREDKGLEDSDVLLSVVVQQMVRSDMGASGVMFTADPESGFRDVIVINASWGLGEMLVQGRVAPDEYLVSKKAPGTVLSPIISKHLGRKEAKMVYAGGKGGIARTREMPTTAKERSTFVLTDKEISQLAALGMAIEKHYSQKAGVRTPMDIECAKDGRTGCLFIVQARPETVHATSDFSKVKEYVRKENGKELARGSAVGNGIASGASRIIVSAGHIARFKKGEILVTRTTDPDWEPIMKIASAIVTETGSRTSHAAIIARELGIPAIVGAEHAMAAIPAGRMITVDATGTEGLVLEGALKYDVKEHNVRLLPQTRTKIMMNIATPDTAFRKSFLPHHGVGLARLEFIIASEIGVHPLALAGYNNLPTGLKRAMDKKTAGWQDKKKFYVDHLAYGIAKIGLAFHPHPVIVRFSDFKSNEYRTLIGGERYEPVEENPMIGWRGASRYYDPRFKDAFLWECEAIARVRDEMHLKNVIPMVPFCRTPEEGEKTLAIMAEAGLVTRYMKEKKKFPANTETVPVYVMCEIPSNVIQADRFLDIFDGMSIGSNDLTQLTLGLDRDAGALRHVGDENDAAVKEMVRMAIRACKKRGKYIGICGQAPSDHPAFAQFLVEEDIESMSLNPDVVIRTIVAVAELEKNLDKRNKKLPTSSNKTAYIRPHSQQRQIT